MELSTHLYPTLLPEIKTSVWYRQRFDACPHFMFFIGEAHTSEIQHTAYPFGQRLAYAGFSKNRADWYHSLPELKRTADAMIAAAQQDPDISKKIIRDFEPWQEAFYAMCAQIREMDLSALSDVELLKTYTDLASVYTKKLNASPLIDGFALSTDEMISSRIRAFLEERGEGASFVEYFEILTAPVFTSFLQQEEIDLLRVAIRINRFPEEKTKLLEEHQQKYFWIQNNYVKDHVVDVATFEQRIEEWNEEEYEERLRTLEGFPRAHAERKRELQDRIVLPQELATLLTITDDFNAWQDERKKGTFWATHYFSVLLEEFSRRTGYAMDELTYCFPPEMESVLKKEISKDELQKRFAYCMLVWSLDVYDVTTDPEMIAMLDTIGTGAFVHTDELKGFSAQLGKVRGRVKIVESVQEIDKVQEGEILVAVMTRPDYLPAMKKALAFVTDEGGITCHAAIVAREMRKPCIVGTKIATKILKDGDEVEVDADMGVVRIIT